MRESTIKKLEPGHKHIMMLIDKDKKADGWSHVSDQLFPHLSSHMPVELVEFFGKPGGYKARLTEKGNNILMAMDWLC